MRKSDRTTTWTCKIINQEWPNYGQQATSSPPTRLILPAKYLAHFFKHHISNCRKQCNSIGFCL